ncbi:MAG: hypothetical protein M4579_000832 [Chaenotheca gracillima]|nr:MAG: hypothetical protein M4579_000832 [Chaenotheca gracillima]
MLGFIVETRHLSPFEPEGANKIALEAVRSVQQPESRPPQRRTSIFAIEEEQEDHSKQSHILARPAARRSILMDSSKPRRRRVSAMLADWQSGATAKPQIPEEPREEQEQGEERDPRRRTIYIPSDDTTILTIHPGTSMHSFGTTRASLEEAEAHRCLRSLPERDEGMQQGNHLHERAPRRAPRKSLATAPKKAPLQTVTRPVQPLAAVSDVAGRPNGKENIPPGKHLHRPTRRSSMMLSKPTEDREYLLGNPVQASQDPKMASSRRNLVPSNFQSETLSKKQPSSDFDGSNTQKGNSRLKRQATDPFPPQSAPLRKTLCSKAGTANRVPLSASPQESARGQLTRKLPTKLNAPLVTISPPDNDPYPVLSEHISRPEMYEDNWLSHQEAAITQLVNGLFSAADKNKTKPDHQALRGDLLNLYQDTSVSLLYKRVQASLLYGALKIPKELLSRSGGLQEDLGLRRKFLDLWLDSYDLPSLRGAVEVIVGREIRQISIRPRRSDPDPKVAESRALKKAIEGFLETFFIRHEDAIQVASEVGSIRNIARTAIGGGAQMDRKTDEMSKREWAWGRTVLRSLMLIYLLDRGKREGILLGRHFRKESLHKSSVSVLQGLSNLLLPSLGDIARPLSHLNYEVSHVQLPLEEYGCRIGNLATDMRDGVLLTRLVELLLYPPSSLERVGDMTVTMPTGDVLTMDNNASGGWILSQHLKFPCIGHAQKIFNVQLALSALQGVTRGTANLAGVRAEDIVIGHREKTIGLLWGLVSKWGLGMLVDWDRLQREVRRLKDRYRERRIHQLVEHAASIHDDTDESEDEDEPDDLEGFERYAWLLKAWASIIAKSHNLQVTNLSTSFTDGKVFEKIVTEYEDHLLRPGAPAFASSVSLEDRLKSIGCSQYFGT